MRVAIDGRRLQDEPPGGVGRGLANLLAFLPETVEPFVLVDSSRPLPDLSGTLSHIVALRRSGHLPEPVWLQTAVPAWLARHRMPFHGTYNATPLATQSPTIVTIHDLSWERHPVDFPSRARRETFRVQARWAARRASAVVTVSEFVKQELLDSYRLPAEKVVVVPNAVDARFSAARGCTPPPGLGLPTSYIVALGGARRRRLDLAIEAWRRARRELGASGEELTLAVVGAEEPPPERGLLHLGRLADDAWPAVLASAETFLYPTEYEGFGMPALEAAAAGTPVVCSPKASLPEVLGDAAAWSESLEPDALANSLLGVVTDPARRNLLSTAGVDRADRWPSWAECARRLAGIYEAVAS